ncbi:hypothetical protein P9112_005523 [Eukaryota sp. TZLM1-RC]
MIKEPPPGAVHHQQPSCKFIAVLLFAVLCRIVIDYNIYFLVYKTANLSSFLVYLFTATVYGVSVYVLISFSLFALSYTIPLPLTRPFTFLFYFYTSLFLSGPILHYYCLSMGGFPFSPTTFSLFVSDFNTLISAFQDGMSILMDGDTSLTPIFLGLCGLGVIFGLFYFLHNFFGYKVQKYLKLCKKSRLIVAFSCIFLFCLLFSFFINFSSLEPFERHWFRGLRTDISRQDLEKSGKILRDFFPLPSDRYWLSEDYPLVHGNLLTYCELFPEGEECTPDKLKITRDQVKEDEEIERPNIILISWESLSGIYLPMTDLPKADDATPYLNKYFKENGVFYHECVVTASPSANSLWTTVNQGPSLHKANFLQTEHVHFDSIYSLIKRSPADYVTGFISTANPPYDRQNMILDNNKEYLDEIYFRYENGDTYDEEFYYGVDKNRFARWNNDRILVEQAADRWDYFKSEYGNRPFFHQLISMSTHIDFSTLDRPQKGEKEFPSLKRDRYVRALKYSDQYLVGKLINNLEDRNMLDNTVIFVIGDHGAFNQGLGYKCKDCPPQGFDGDQVFYTTATLLFFGEEGRREQLGIPPAGSVDYTPVSNLDVIATIAELAGSKHDVTSSLGRSLLNPLVDKKRRKTLSMTQSYAELGLQDVIVRMNWLKSIGVSIKRPHPTYNASNVEEDIQYFDYVQSVADAWHNLVFANRVWNFSFIGKKVTKYGVGFTFPFGFKLLAWLFITSSAFELILVIVKKMKTFRKIHTVEQKKLIDMEELKVEV